MSTAPRPDNDRQRIAALDATGVLNRRRDGEFERLAAEAALSAGTTIGLVNFVAADRQWTKAAVGLDIESVPRDSAFCTWAIYNAELLWVEDALEDERFADNPLVQSEPRIRHYAGAPIITPHGYALGAVCVLDRRPHPFDSDVAAMLTRLAEEASRVLADASKLAMPLARVA